MSELDFNCDCESTPEDTATHETLSELRLKVLRRLGYAAQSSTPPPGVAALINDWLFDAQKQIYEKHIEMRVSRFYRWTLDPDTPARYYGILDVDSDTEFTCTKTLDPYGVEGVWIEDMNGTWLPMKKGIDPILYTNESQPGIPYCWDIRSCIEIFPAPDQAYKLWIKGRFGLEQFTADGDRTTIDSHAVYLLALGNAMTERGKAGAQNVLRQAGNYLLDRKASRHAGRRYITGKKFPPPLTKPVRTPVV